MVSSSHRPLRSVAAGVCGTVGVVLLLLASSLTFLSRALFDADYFASRVADSLADPRTASYVAEQITESVVAANADLILVRPLIKTSAQTVVSSGPFRAVAREAVKQSHVLLATSGGREVLLSVSDFGVILHEALADRPELAAMIPRDAVVVLGNLHEGYLLDASTQTLRLGQRVGRWPQLVFLMGVILLVTGILLACEREFALLRAGIAVTAAMGVTLLVLELGVLFVVRIPSDPALGQALAGVWSTFVAGFRVRIAIVGGTGLLMTAAATAFLETMNLASISRGLWHFLTEPLTSRWLRLVRGLALLLLGILALLDAGLATRILISTAGGVLAFLGMRELSRLAVDPAERLNRRVARLESRTPRGSRWLRRTLIALAVLVLLVPGALTVTQMNEEEAATATMTMACNGLPELCDTPLDQVVFACTHNAMGAADIPGWLFPNQQYGIQRQLEDGIRALMLDVIPGIPAGSAVKTDLGPNELSREKLEPILGSEGLDAALRIRERLLGAEEETGDIYLCHALCELGATRLVPSLATVRDFLVANPREVLIIIIEDMVPPEAIARACEESGLDEFVYTGPVEPPWPTLGEMAAGGGRVLILGENETAGVPWYHPAWEVVQETRYNFTSAEEFDCAPNRGGTAGSLLLVNHWVNTPPTSLPSDAVVVNARDALLRRVEQCRRQRGRTPNIIAVDFYGVGDLVEVVRELNQAAPGGDTPGPAD